MKAGVETYEFDHVVLIKLSRYCFSYCVCYIISTYFTMRFVHQTCCDETLQSWLLENEALTRQACDALLKNLKKEHLDSLNDRLLEQGGAEVSFDDIIQGFERIKQDFEARAKGAKDVCATMFFEFHPVNEICNTWYCKSVVLCKYYPTAFAVLLNACARRIC